MGQPNNNPPNNSIDSEETILFLFLTFGILIVLILILLLLGFQTYLSWRIAGLLVYSDDDEEMGRGGSKEVKKWEREKRERGRALRQLEKRMSGAGSLAVTRGDEEMGMSGARGSSVLLDHMKLKDGEKKPIWTLKGWF